MLCKILNVLTYKDTMTARNIILPTITSVLLWGALMPVSALAKDDGPLTVMGLSVGQNAVDIAGALSKTDFKAADARPRKGRRESAKRQQLRYETEAGDKISFEIAARQGAFTEGHIIGLNYTSSIADDAIVLERKLRTKFGKPLASFKLTGESHLYVWEQPAPKQSRDFGPLLSVSLKTGDAPALKISQFSRPDIATVAASKQGRRVATAKRAAPVPITGLGLSPVD